MNNNDSTNFVGKRVKELREKRGYSQSELAIKLGYKDKTSIFRIENGISDIPRSRIPKFAEVLGVEPMYFVSMDCTLSKNHFSESEMELLKRVERAGKMQDLIVYAKFLTGEKCL